MSPHTELSRKGLHNLPAAFTDFRRKLTLILHQTWMINKNYVPLQRQERQHNEKESALFLVKSPNFHPLRSVQGAEQLISKIWVAIRAYTRVFGDTHKKRKDGNPLSITKP